MVLERVNITSAIPHPNWCSADGRWRIGHDDHLQHLIFLSFQISGTTHYHRTSGWVES